MFSPNPSVSLGLGSLAPQCQGPGGGEVGAGRHTQSCVFIDQPERPPETQAGQRLRGGRRAAVSFFLIGSPQELGAAALQAPSAGALRGQP